jgi:predicted membrane-bound spermidine synthase
MLIPIAIILLFEGFITISVELILIRQLIPFYGNSVIVTSVFIGIFLLFLAIGYWRGSKSQEIHFIF